MKKHIILLYLLFVSAGIMAQGLPAEMYLSPDGKMLLTGGKPATGLYDSAIIRDVKLTFSQPNFWTLLTNNYQSQTEIPADLEIDGVTYPSVGVRFRGNTSYTQLGTSQKKSFKISVDFTDTNQRVMGYRSLKLNNEFGDQSFLREVFYLNQIKKHIPAAKANFVHLYLNNEDWGIYPNVQLLNKDFLKEWFLSNDGINWRADAPTAQGPGGPGGGPQWGDGTAALNYLGADTNLYKARYTLKSSDMNDPWTKLVAGCNALNNTPTNDLPNVLPQYLDIDRTLWFLASEIAFSDDDSYIMKGKMDYYAYYEKETGRLTPLEYDGNSVLSGNNINWGAFYNANNMNYPLLNKLLAVPQWRQRYLAHLRTIINEELNAVSAIQTIDNLKNQIDALYQSDPKKIYTYSQFTTAVSTLKNLVNTRRNNLLANMEVAQVAPTINWAKYHNPALQEWTPPTSQEEVVVTTSVTSGNGIFRVNLFYSGEVVGNFTSVQMFDDGNHQDGTAGDGVYGAAIPAYAAGTWVRFYIEALANNGPKSAKYHPEGAEHNVFVYKVKQSMSPVTGVVINEFMASNTSSVQDEANQYDDWIELYNNNNYPVNIGGFYLSDNSTNPGKWEIPAETVIQPNGYLIFWADEDQTQGNMHTNFKLSASGGEFLSLTDSNRDVMDSLSFGVQTTDMSYSRIPNGNGPFLIKMHTFNANNESQASISENESLSFLVAPNPVQQTLNVTLPDNESGKSLQVVNTLGVVLYSNIPTGSIKIDVSGWTCGVYFLKYGNHVERFIIVH